MLLFSQNHILIQIHVVTFSYRVAQYEIKISQLTYLRNFQSNKTISPENKKDEDEDMMMKEKDSKSVEIVALKEELENVRKTHKDQKEEAVRKSQLDLENKLKDAENHLIESKMKLQELEANLSSKNQLWTKKEHIYKTFTEFQLGALKVICVINN